VSQFDQLGLTLQQLGVNAALLEQSYLDLKVQEKRLGEEVIRLKEDILITQQAEEVIGRISQQILGQSISTVDQLITGGLRLVFDNQQLEFRTTTEKLRGKTTAKFHLNEDGKSWPLMDSYGGGVLVVAGVLLRVTVIVVLGLRRILLLDESLSHLSPQYVENASKLLKKIGADLGFEILLITHDAELAVHADHHYQATKGPNGTVFKKVR